MTFRIDKHLQLRIKDVEDFNVSKAEPDVLVLSREETEALAVFLLPIVDRIPIKEIDEMLMEMFNKEAPAKIKILHTLKGTRRE
jgi:hypothetical protein